MAEIFGKNLKTRDFGIRIGHLECGALDKISDVKGVKVGHYTLDTDRYHTGVTVVMPSDVFIYDHKLPCACFVQNGFGKSLGTVQIEELGTLETPIALTSTLNVGLVHDAMVGYIQEERKKRGSRVYTVNPIVCECNDSENSYACDRPIREEHVKAAIAACKADFEEGSVGAGRGTICHRLKGGIGSASRIVPIRDKHYTVGVLVQSNQGSLPDLTIDGNPVGAKITERLYAQPTPDIGSIIVIVATDAPLSDRQLKRLIKRATVGVVRVGSHLGHGSGDVYIGFSTANSIPQTSDVTYTGTVLNEDYLEALFYGVAEATEEAILNSMLSADALMNPSGDTFHSLTEFKDLFQKTAES